jgi:hypothetical protein
MIIDAPREQWLIDLRAYLVERYPAVFLNSWAYGRQVNAWISEYARDPRRALPFVQPGEEYEGLLAEIEMIYEEYLADQEEY